MRPPVGGHDTDHRGGARRPAVGERHHRARVPAPSPGAPCVAMRLAAIAETATAGACSTRKRSEARGVAQQGPRLNFWPARRGWGSTRGRPACGLAAPPAREALETRTSKASSSRNVAGRPRRSAPREAREHRGARLTRAVRERPEAAARRTASPRSGVRESARAWRRRAQRPRISGRVPGGGLAGGGGPRAARSRRDRAAPESGTARRRGPPRAGRRRPESECPCAADGERLGARGAGP